MRTLDQGEFAGSRARIEHLTASALRPGGPRGYPLSMHREAHFVRCVGFLLGFTVATASACKAKPDEQELCEGFLAAPSAGFPSFVEDTGAGMPQVGFQVCDSVAIDLNDDGLLDFAAANHISAGFGYFMQEPGAAVTFSTGVSVPFVSGGNSAGIVAEDFNGDGILDIGNSDHPGIVTVRINATPSGAATDEVDFPTAGETNIDLGVDHDGHGFAGVEGGLVAADFNGDGKIDIATSNLGLNAANQATSSVLLNTTADPVDDGMGNLIYPMVASFAAGQYIELPGPAISITTEDFNSDGVPDFATSNTAVSSISVMTNQTTAGATIVTFDELALEIPAEGNPAGAGPTNPVAADFNNDGKPDIVTANWNVDTVTLYTNTTTVGGATEFALEPYVIDLCFNPLIVRHGDLDGDGDQDLVIVPLDLPSGIAVGVIENKLQAGTDIPSLAMVEIVYLPERMQEVTFIDWLTGKSSGRSPGIWFASTANVADFNGDGTLELVLAVAHGDFAIELQSQLIHTDNILEYVVPPVSQQIADAFLPRHTELLYLVPE